MVKHSNDTAPITKSTRERMPAWKRLGAAAAVGVAALSLVGCGQSERANPPAAASETPGASPSETQSNTGENIGQDTEIAHDQLNILEQTTPVEDMLAMSDDERAQLSVGDRAALGYYLTQKLVPENLLASNVGTVDADQISFFSIPAKKIRSGTPILSAMGTQFGSLVNANENEAAAFAAAMWYDTTEGDSIASNIKEQIADNIAVSQMGHADVQTPHAEGETGWFEVEDQGQKQWVKVIHEVTGNQIDRTVQYVRATVRTLEGKEVFFYMQGRTSDLHDGELIEEYAKLPIGE